MNTLDDLRTSLARHAEISDDGLATRTASVHDRVRVVRRNRRAGLAGAAAAAVAVVGGLTLLTGPGDDTADRLVAGRTAPATITAQGYTFEFDHAEESDGARPLRLRVRADEAPLLVAWTAPDDARLKLPDAGVDRFGDVFGNHFADHELVTPGNRAAFALANPDGEGRLGFAVYRLAEAAPGVTSGFTTFRQEVGRDQLLGAVIGEPGDTEVSMRVTVPDARIRIAEACLGDPEGWVAYSVNGSTMTGSACGDSAPVWDPGAGSHFFWQRPGIKVDGRTYRPGDQVTVTARLQRSQDDARPPADAGARVMVGLYAMEKPETSNPIRGLQFEHTLTQAGHDYTWLGAITGGPGQGRLAGRLPVGDRPVFVKVGFVSELPSSMLEVSLGGSTRTGAQHDLGTGSAGQLGVGVVPPGTATRVVARLAPMTRSGEMGDPARVGPRDQMVILFYERTD